METLIKTRKARVRKETNPQITALKKSVSVALKAAWNVEAVKLRKEKAVRKERGTLEKKVEEQREALKAAELKGREIRSEILLAKKETSQLSILAKEAALADMVHATDCHGLPP
jgi:hypothetical protein